MELNFNRVPVYSAVLVKLLKGPIYEQDQKLWPVLLQHRKGILDFFSQIAIKLYVDEVEGHAFLKPLSEEEEQAWGDHFGEDPPRLISRRKLNYLQTLLLVLLRKLLLEHDATSGGSRLIVARKELLEQVKPFLPETYNKTKQEREVNTAVNSLEELSILRKLPNDEENLEVNRILKARITPKELDDMLAMLKSYDQHNGD